VIAHATLPHRVRAYCTATSSRQNSNGLSPAPVLGTIKSSSCIGEVALAYPPLLSQHAVLNFVIGIDTPDADLFFITQQSLS